MKHGFENRWGRDFPELSLQTLSSAQPPVKWGKISLSQGLLPPRKRHRGEALTTHPHLDPGESMDGAITLPPLGVWLAWNGTDFERYSYWETGIVIDRLLRDMIWEILDKFYALNSIPADLRYHKKARIMPNTCKLTVSLESKNYAQYLQTYSIIRKQELCPIPADLQYHKKARIMSNTCRPTVS